MLYEKGYQNTDEAITAVTLKLKGITLSNISGTNGFEERIWDSQDLVKPALENNALFVTTRLIITPNQVMSKCPEETSISSAICMSDQDCKRGEIDHLGNGVPTGKCVTRQGASNGTCEILAWCPLENEDLLPPERELIFPEVVNFTLMIKCDILFEKFGVSRRNILDWFTKDFLHTCRYKRDDPKLKYCPIFEVATILKEAKFTEEMFMKGGVVKISIDWKCDLDWSVNDCRPEYSFTMLDTEPITIARGFNMRYSEYYYENGVRYRTLHKAYGIRFIIDAYGVAGKFDLLPFTINIGSGIGWLSLAPVICDFIAFTLLKTGRVYERVRVEYITLEREERELTEMQMEDTLTEIPETK